MTLDDHPDFLKRKLSNSDCQISSSDKKQHLGDQKNDDDIVLSLGFSSPTRTPPCPLQIPPLANFPDSPLSPARPSPSPIIPYPGPRSRRSLSRRNPTQRPREGKNDTVPAPYPWATNRRATVHGMDYLLANNLTTICGTVQCKRCEKQFDVEYDLLAKFTQVYNFIVENKSSMHDRAPSMWMNPVLPACRFCEQENSAKPVIAQKKGINWLFLLLGQMLGCCTLGQLKYFCKHTKNHRTGAKDRVLYLTYLGLCKQLDPTGPFDR